MSVAINPAFDFTVIETLDPDLARETSVAHNENNLSDVVLNASSTPAVTKHSSCEHTLTAGAKTIDLTAAPVRVEGGETADMTGLKLQTMTLSCPAANTTAITVAVGASNGYEFMGSDGKLKIYPGCKLAVFFDDETPDVGATDKAIDLAGSGVETISISMTFG